MRAATIAPHRRLAFALALAVLVLDQASKWAILAFVMAPPRRLEVTPFFDVVLAWNRGVSFSLLQSDWPWGPYLLSGIALTVVGVLVWWLRRVGRAWPAAALGLAIGGALGNVIDRLRFGAVVDFLDLHAGDYHWPAFNLADSAITVGVAILIFDGLLRRPERSK